MHQARGGMGSRKHGKHGISGKSPRFRHAMKREAEKNERKQRSRIRDPKSSVRELFDWWAVRDLNPRHPGCKPGALPLS